MILLHLLLMYLSLGSGACLTVENCPADLARNTYLQVHGGVCYQFNVDQLEYFGYASEDCQHQGGQLVMIKSKEVNDYVTEQLRRYKAGEAWIGATDTLIEGKFVWMDGSHVNYTNWGLWEGGGDTDDCVSIDAAAGGYWRDHSCETSSGLLGLHSLPLFGNIKKRNYVCQFIPGMASIAVTTSTVEAFMTTENGQSTASQTLNVSTGNPMTLESASTIPTYLKTTKGAGLTGQQNAMTTTTPSPPLTTIRESTVERVPIIG